MVRSVVRRLDALGSRERPQRRLDLVDRANRVFRLLEKVRYKWRRRRTLVRFVVVMLDEVWSNWPPPEVRGVRARGIEEGLQDTI